MTEMLLLGAGASVDAGVPASFDMSGRILEELANDRHRRVVSLVLGGLMFQQGAAGLNPIKNRVDVESLFSAILLLSERRTFELAPFVSAWNPFVDELDVPRNNPFAGNRLVDTIGNAMFSTSGGGWWQVETELAGFISQFKSGSGGGAVFSETAEEMVRTLRVIAWIDTSDRVDYLSPLIELLTRQERLVITTLNYDNSMSCWLSHAEWNATPASISGLEPGGSVSETRGFIC